MYIIIILSRFTYYTIMCKIRDNIANTKKMNRAMTILLTHTRMIIRS